jgi:hypothetical protein
MVGSVHSTARVCSRWSGARRAVPWQSPAESEFVNDGSNSRRHPRGHLGAYPSRFMRSRSRSAIWRQDTSSQPSSFSTVMRVNVLYSQRVGHLACILAVHALALARARPSGERKARVVADAGSSALGRKWSARTPDLNRCVEGARDAAPGPGHETTSARGH